MNEQPSTEEAAAKPKAEGFAIIMNDPEYDSVAMVERRRWRIAFSAYPDRRRFTTTKREAIEWCDDMGIDYILAPPARPRGEVRR